MVGSVTATALPSKPWLLQQSSSHCWHRLRSSRSICTRTRHMYGVWEHQECMKQAQQANWKIERRSALQTYSACMCHVRITEWKTRLHRRTHQCVYSSQSVAAIAQLGERQTEDLKVPGSIPGLGIVYFNCQWRRVVTCYHSSHSRKNLHSKSSTVEKLTIKNHSLKPKLLIIWLVKHALSLVNRTLIFLYSISLETKTRL